ncbi:hypothetical protein NPY00_05280 [Bartonella sp. F2]|nr:hypothetical protein [Bartonella sp. F02]MCZ2328853.1 hypothetical protein [Bartonella sp. F02]
MQKKNCINSEKNHFSTNSKKQEICIETSNPYFQATAQESSSNPRTIFATINARNHPIALLYAKGHISKAQYKASERFYFYWSQSRGETSMSLDYSRQKVDGGHCYTNNIERQIDASNHLKEIKTQLGVLGYSLVERVIGYGQAVKNLSASKRKQNSLADHLRDCLDLMATHWGYSNH